ncbi:MAG: hypothetical protein WCW54_04150 [Candidatus Paceibacterota bacterium]|jgi:hypothetical protein
MRKRKKKEKTRLQSIKSKMINIRQLLFGTKKLVETKKLGTFDATVRNENTAKEITWCSTIKIVNYSDDITILLEGDAFGPAKIQIESATWIIENIKEIDKELISKINSNSELNEKYRNNNLTDLRLSCLNPWEISLNSYELSYESKSENEFSVSAIVQKNKIIEVY